LSFDVYDLVHVYMLYLNAFVDVDVDVGSKIGVAYVCRRVDFTIDVKFRLDWSTPNLVMRRRQRRTDADEGHHPSLVI